LFFLNICKGSG